MIIFGKLFLIVPRYIIWKGINKCLLIFEKLGTFGPSIALPSNTVVKCWYMCLKRTLFPNVWINVVSENHIIGLVHQMKKFLNIDPMGFKLNECQIRFKMIQIEYLAENVIFR